MLTPEQVLEARQKLGINPTGGIVSEQATGQNLLSRLKGEPKEPSFLGKVVRETIRPIANTATNLVNAGQIALGQEETQPFSGEFLGEVPGLGKVDLTKSPLDPENLKTINKSVKAGVDVGLLLAGGGGAGEAVKTGIKQGIIQGAKAGAKTGAIIGGTSGASTALEEGATVGSTLENTVTGAASGAVLGGVLGGATGGVSSAISTTKKLTSGLTDKGTKIINKITGQPQNETEFALDLVSPKATEKVKQQAIAQGRVTEQGIIRPSKILPSKRDIQLAESVKGVVSMKKTPLQNVEALDSAVSKINNRVKSYVKKNKVPFNTNQLKSQLNRGKEELKVIFASDTTAEKTYDVVIKEFMKHVKSKDTAGLLDARQAVDKIPAIKKLLDSRGLGENVKKEVVLTVRRMANEYVASLLPKGNKYRADLLRESHMLEVIFNMAMKESKEIGLNKIQSLTLKYPILKWAVSGLVGAGGIGVGSAIIGSLD